MDGSAFRRLRRALRALSVFCGPASFRPRRPRRRLAGALVRARCRLGDRRFAAGPSRVLRRRPVLHPPPPLTALSSRALASVSIREARSRNSACDSLLLSATSHTHNWGLLLLPRSPSPRSFLARPGAIPLGVGPPPPGRCRAGALSGPFVEPRRRSRSTPPGCLSFRSHAGALYLFSEMVQKRPSVASFPVAGPVGSGVGTT